MNKTLSFLWEIVKIVVITLAIVLPIRYFLIQPFFVKGASMEPNFEDRQYLIIDEISYRYRPAERGEVIVFRFPLDTREFYIKRVIGLPGESVEVIDGRVKIYNAAHPLGFVLDESDYLSSDVSTFGDGKKTQLGTDEYFVMGDNRSASYDSRRWGPVSKSNIIGRAWLRAWPLQNLSVFGMPQYSY